MPEYIPIRPRFDEATVFSHKFAERIIDWLKEKGKSFIDLSDVDAVRDKVHTALKQNPSAKVIFFNHGDETSLMGNNGIPVIDMENVDLLTGREYTFTLACLWGKEGGAQAWRENCRAVYCYNDVVSFTSDAQEEFTLAFTEGFFLREEQGLDWKEILQKMKELMTELTGKLIGQGKLIAASCMEHDRDILVIYNGGSEPPTPCPFRMGAVRVFGPRIGYKIPRRVGWGILLFLAGWGLALHNFAHGVWELKGTAVSLEGGYIGFTLVLIGFFLLTWQYVDWLKKG